MNVKRTVQVQRPRLSLVQKIRLDLFQITPTVKKTRAGWKGELQFYAFRCPVHGIVEDYPHGYNKVLQCPICRASE